MIEISVTTFVTSEIDRSSSKTESSDTSYFLVVSVEQSAVIVIDQIQLLFPRAVNVYRRRKIALNLNCSIFPTIFITNFRRRTQHDDIVASSVMTTLRVVFRNLMLTNKCRLIQGVGNIMFSDQRVKGPNNKKRSLHTLYNDFFLFSNFYEPDIIV